MIMPSSPYPTLEYLNRVFAGMMSARSRLVVRTTTSSGNGLVSCQKSASRPSRITPPP